MARTHRHQKPGPDYHPIHDAVFGPDDEFILSSTEPDHEEDMFEQEADAEDSGKPMVDDTPRGASHARTYMENSPGEPGRFQPMRDVGDTDPTDRQPDGTLRR